MKVVIGFAILGAVREFAKGFSPRGQAIIYGLFLEGMVIVGQLVWKQEGIAWATPITAALGIGALNLIPIIRRYAKEIEICAIVSLLIVCLLVSPKKSAGFIRSTTAATAPSATATTTVGTYTAISDIVVYANQFVGGPYVWGGNSLKNGCDCSHFVYNVLRDMGYYSGEYVTSEYWAEKGKPVEGGLANAQAGDIVVYAKKNGIGHVAIYDGNGHIIEAQSSKAGITNNRKADNGRTIIAVRRFTKTNKPSESQACLPFTTYVTILC